MACILGIDYGEKKIGLAESEGMLAAPLGVIKIDDQESALGTIKKICQEKNIQEIVIGLPLNERDTTGMRRIKEFGEKLGCKIGLPIFFQDETMSSDEARQKMIEAGKKMKARRTDDAFAAAIILQEYLDKTQT